MTEKRLGFQIIEANAAMPFLGLVIPKSDATQEDIIESNFIYSYIRGLHAEINKNTIPSLSFKTTKIEGMGENIINQSYNFTRKFFLDPMRPSIGGALNLYNGSTNEYIYPNPDFQLLLRYIKDDNKDAYINEYYPKDIVKNKSILLVTRVDFYDENGNLNVSNIKSLEQYRIGSNKSVQQGGENFELYDSSKTIGSLTQALFSESIKRSKIENSFIISSSTNYFIEEIPDYFFEKLFELYSQFYTKEQLKNEIGKVFTTSTNLTVQLKINPENNTLSPNIATS